MLSALTSAMKTFLTTVDKNINKSINKLTQEVTTLIFKMQRSLLGKVAAPEWGTEMTLIAQILNVMRRMTG